MRSITKRRIASFLFDVTVTVLAVLIMLTVLGGAVLQQSYRMTPLTESEVLVNE